ncbi:protein of unknown function [Candidatus Nitrosotalea okcheonensis]|uniref:Uncharacterized protein n=1 Tax=Candidatus Nitrosotalea okcheonensis TaxID=1903276 RepID=A0A2H1FHJ7_9ARCH|nr:protein of unknown function [Candidatus Nitrosotalea okcheonensis]
MQSMCQDMDLCILVCNKFSIHPNLALLFHTVGWNSGNLKNNKNHKISISGGTVVFKSQKSITFHYATACTLTCFCCLVCNWYCGKWI